MKVRCGIEAEINAAWGAAIPEPHFSAIVTRIEVDVYEHRARIVARQFDIDFLPWPCAMEEEARDEARAAS